MREKCYRLLFKLCLENSNIKRYLIKNHIQTLLEEDRKELINDLVIELLETGEGLLQEYITSRVIEAVIRQFRQFYLNSSAEPLYSISYLRLFRIFCGNDHQPCQRNQSIIFDIFFSNSGRRSSIRIPSHRNEPMTVSHLNLVNNRSAKVYEDFKFEIIKNSETGTIQFLCNQEQKDVTYFTQNPNIAEYLRQYFYLLSDTMKNNNEQTITIFKNRYPLSILIDALTDSRQEMMFLKGPILNLIVSSYLSNEKKYRFYIFYKSYQRLCFMGHLKAQSVDPEHQKLQEYIKREIRTTYSREHLQKWHFKSTTFKHFLSLIKLSIETGMWSDEDELEQTVRWLQKIFQFEEQLRQYHESYSQKLEESNMMHSKALAVDVYTLYTDLKINMCISELLEIDSVSSSRITDIEQKIQSFYEESTRWNLNRIIFTICSTSNSELMKKSLHLFKKLYDIKQIVEEEFYVAKRQIAEQSENENLKKKISFITESNYECKIDTERDCELYITACFDKRLKDNNKDQFSLASIKNQLRNSETKLLQTIYRYQKPNEQFQNLAYKLGFHSKIIQKLGIYLSLRREEQSFSKKDTISSQLFLLLALIKGNSGLKAVVADYRSMFISLLSDENELYYVACQILIQIFIGNRKLAVSDTENLQKICIEISQSLKKGTNVLKKLEKNRVIRKSLDKQSKIEKTESFTDKPDIFMEKTQTSHSEPRQSLAVNRSSSLESPITSGKRTFQDFEPTKTDSPFFKKEEVRPKALHRVTEIEPSVTSCYSSISLKDCKLLSLLLTFIKVENKRLEKNEKIISKYVFNKENIALLHQKISSYQSEDTLINIFKILVLHLMRCLRSGNKAPMSGHQAAFQGQKSIEKKDGFFQMLLEVKISSLNNLLFSLERVNWEVKTIVFKFLEERIQKFDKDNLQFLLRLILKDLNVFCQIIMDDEVYLEKQPFSQSPLVRKHSLQSSSLEKSRKSYMKVFRRQIEAFRFCCPHIVRCIEATIVKLLSEVNSAQKYTKNDSKLISLLLMNVERLFLMRQIIPFSVVSAVEKLPFTMGRLVEKEEQQGMAESLDLDMLFKISLQDFSAQDLHSQQSKIAPLVFMKSEEGNIISRDKVIFQKNQSEDEALEGLMLFERVISSSEPGVASTKKLAFPAQTEVLKEFIKNLITVNSQNSNVLTDELKTFFLTYLSNSYLESQENEYDFLLVQQVESNPRFIDKKETLEGYSFEKRQNLLIEYQIPLVICTILEEGFKNRYSLYSNLFELGNRILEGGNTKGQHKFLEAFKEDQKNHIFQNIHNLIQELVETIKFYYTDENVVRNEIKISQQTAEELSQTKRQRKVVCKLLCEVFRFIQLLCENNNQEMKNFIFSQSDENNKIKYLSVNFLSVGIDVFHQVFKVIEGNISVLSKKVHKGLAQEIQENLFAIPSSVLDFLIEVCQIPALQNQVFLCKTDFFKSIQKMCKLSGLNKVFLTIKDYGTNSIAGLRSDERFRLSSLFFPDQGKPNSENVLFVYQRKLIILFRSLLEQQNQEIIDIMGKKLGKEEFEYFIEEALLHGGLEDTDKLKILLTEPKLNHYLETIVDVLIVKKTLVNSEDMKFDGIKREIISSLETRIQSININFQNQSLTVYFPYHPLFELLTKRTQKFFLDRSIGFKSRNEKLRDFIVSRNVIYQDIENEKNSETKVMTDSSMSSLYFLSIALAYLVLVLLILFYSVSKSGTVLDVIEAQIISGLSLTQLVISTIYTVIWGINIAPITREKLKTKSMSANQMPAQGALNIDKSRKKGSLLQNFQISSTLRDRLAFLKQIYIEEPASFHAILLFLVSAGSFFLEPRLYSFTLVFFFTRIELLESILKAIRLTWKQLLIVCLLAVVFSFIFGFLSINNYIIPLYENQQIDIDINRINEHCNSITTCINSLYTQQIIGESVNQNGDEKQFLSDLTYWGFFEILLTNIIAAIIIDKFAEQRNAKEKIENQRHNRCYICSADKATLQRKGVEFGEHVNKTHFIWNYFYYMYSLERLKKNTEFTGIEYWIEHQIRNTKIDWIPLDESKRDDFTDEKIDYIYSWIRKGHLSINSRADARGFESPLLKGTERVIQGSSNSLTMLEIQSRLSIDGDILRSSTPKEKVRKIKKSYVELNEDQDDD